MALLFVLAIGGCGGGDSTDSAFSASAFDSVQQGDSAESVKVELGDPASTEAFAKGSELWVYCDGSSPRYLVVTDGSVSIAAVRPADELRISEGPCQ